MAKAPNAMVLKVKVEFDPPIEEVRRLLLRPGEVLVVRLSEDIPAEHAKRLKDQLREMFEGHAVMVLAPSVEVETIQRLEPNTGDTA